MDQLRKWCDGVHNVLCEQIREMEAEINFETTSVDDPERVALRALSDKLQSVRLDLGAAADRLLAKHVEEEG